MNYEQARDALKGIDVKMMGQSGKVFIVIIGNAGRNMNKTRTFQAAKLETIVQNIKQVYKC